jgi:hypothetical protein
MLSGAVARKVVVSIFVPSGPRIYCFYLFLPLPLLPMES